MDYTTRSSRLESDTGTEPEIRSERERWKSHHLYESNTKLKLEAMCRDLRIPVALEKHQLVNLICNYHKETLPDPFSFSLLWRIIQHTTSNSWHKTADCSKIEKHLAIS